MARKRTTEAIGAEYGVMRADALVKRGGSFHHLHKKEILRAGFAQAIEALAPGPLDILLVKYEKIMIDGEVVEVRLRYMPVDSFRKGTRPPSAVPES